jgi:hypothetical protein
LLLVLLALRMKKTTKKLLRWTERPAIIAQHFFASSDEKLIALQLSPAYYTEVRMCVSVSQ